VTRVGVFETDGILISPVATELLSRSADFQSDRSPKTRIG
jgi:hypothetical protein